MARGVNKVILIGNLGRDPEIRYTQDQRPIANLRIATSDRWQDRSTNEWRDRTEWHSVVCFARLAEICNEYLRKGSKVYIEGRLQTRSWEGQDGQTRYATEVVAREMQMLDGRGRRRRWLRRRPRAVRPNRPPAALVASRSSAALRASPPKPRRPRTTTSRTTSRSSRWTVGARRRCADCILRKTPYDLRP